VAEAEAEAEAVVGAIAAVAEMAVVWVELGAGAVADEPLRASYKEGTSLASYMYLTGRSDGVGVRLTLSC
jgi:hypothetical protein